MTATTEITCKCGCGRKRAVRTADIKRGWGKFYNKSCKAVYQTRTQGDGRKRRYYENEFGGTAQFGNNGEYEGFVFVYKR